MTLPLWVVVHVLVSEIMMNSWIFIAVVIFLGVIYFVSTCNADKEMLERFSDRKPIDFDEFYALHYAGLIDQKLVQELMEHVADELSIPANKLRPDDRFELELKPLTGWEFDSGQNILFIEIDKIAKERGKKVDLNTIRTLDDYIKIMAQLY
jgi:hypothetical protein